MVRVHEVLPVVRVVLPGVLDCVDLQVPLVPRAWVQAILYLVKDLPVQKEVRLTWVQMVRGDLQVHQDHWEVLEAATHMPTTF